MPKRNSRPRDVNEAAFEMVRRSTSEPVDEITIVANPVTPSQANISAVMAEMGRRGGKIGGKRRMQTMSQAQRTRIAKKAAKARWGKKKGGRSGD